MYLLSVIIPVYNVEEYLKECVDSILSQNFKDFEIILVNDGSTDNSQLIIDEYVKKHYFIKCVNKVNGGLSSARNAGIKKAKGKYLLFIDSDDFIEQKTAFDKLKDKINIGIDLIVMDFNKYFYDGTVEKVTNYNFKFNYDETIDSKIKKLILSGNFISSACNKCINKDFFVKNNLYFKEGILSEDVEWSIRLLLCLTSLDYVSNNYYYYRQSREGSISTTFSLKHIKDYKNFLNEGIQLITNSKISLEKKETIFNYLGYQYLVLMAYYVEADSKELKKDVKKLNYLLNYDSLKKVRIINLLRKIIGYDLTAFFMNKFVRNRK